jgi:hypothetical protein
MAKNRHHTVPKFYLRGFASAPKQIHVFHIASSRIILNASLRDQCYRHKFYGKTDEVENALMELESITAPIFYKIIKNSSMSELTYEDHYYLRYFLALQRTRTPKTLSDFKASTDKMTNSMRDIAPEGADISLLDSMIYSEEEALRLLMSSSIDISRVMGDLILRLIVNKSPIGFITSDDPVVQYNQYCEKIQDMGVTGPSKKGFQLFFPISPRHLLFLFDGSVYRTVRLENDSFPASTNDVRQLNLLQAILADKTLMFSSESDADEIVLSNHTAGIPRGQAMNVVKQFYADDDPNQTLHHGFQRIPDINLRLSFLDLRRKATRTPLRERVREREHALTIMDPEGERFGTKELVRTWRPDPTSDNSQ